MTPSLSWGFGCAQSDSLGVYSEVSHFTDWLSQQMPDLNTCPAFTAGASASSSTGPPASSTGTSGSVERPACVEDNIPQKLQVYNKIKKMKNWEDCRDACNADTRCGYFKYKVIHIRYSETFKLKSNFFLYKIRNQLELLN